MTTVNVKYTCLQVPWPEDEHSRWDAKWMVHQEDPQPVGKIWPGKWQILYHICRSVESIESSRSAEPEDFSGACWLGPPKSQSPRWPALWRTPLNRLDNPSIHHPLLQSPAPEGQALGFSLTSLTAISVLYLPITELVTTRWLIWCDCRTNILQINSAKQSAYKFLDVLSKLRDWEICSPDISAAIEFCRDRIVDMCVEDYEAWFENNFPTVRLL